MPNVVFRENRLDRGRATISRVQQLRLLDAALDDLRQRARHPELDANRKLKMKTWDGCLDSLLEFPLRLRLGSLDEFGLPRFRNAAQDGRILHRNLGQIGVRIGTSSLAACIATYARERDQLTASPIQASKLLNPSSWSSSSFLQRAQRRPTVSHVVSICRTRFPYFSIHFYRLLFLLGIHSYLLKVLER